MDRRDWNLLVLAAAKGEPLSPVQLQKSLFLIAKNLESAVGPGFYDFQPYNYGPFDALVYADAREHAVEGLAKVVATPGGWSEYTATPAGIVEAERIESQVPREAAEYVRRIVEWVRRQTFQSLVRSIYEKYPDMKVNSVFQG